MSSKKHLISFDPICYFPHRLPMPRIPKGGVWVTRIGLRFLQPVRFWIVSLNIFFGMGEETRPLG